MVQKILSKPTKQIEVDAKSLSPLVDSKLSGHLGKKSILTYIFFQEGTSTTRSVYVMLAPSEAGASIIHEQNQRLKPETDLSTKMGGCEVSWEKYL